MSYIVVLDLYCSARIVNARSNYSTNKAKCIYKTQF